MIKNFESRVLPQRALAIFEEKAVQQIRERKGAKPIKLSWSRLELIGGYLDHPNQEVADPRNIATEKHLFIVAGDIFHQIVQATSL